MPLNRVSAAQDNLLAALEGATPLDEIAGKVRGVLHKALAPAPLRRHLSGTDVGHPVHPILVQIPIGCWSSAWVLDLMGFGKTTPAGASVGWFGCVGGSAGRGKRSVGLGRHRRSRVSSRPGPCCQQRPCHRVLCRVMVTPEKKPA